jgi:hypothetical protein
MDRVFASFLEEFGAPVDRRIVPASSIVRYRGKLPNLLLEYWAEHGWCGYGEGLFWLVNPEEYDGVVQSWLEGTAFETFDIYHLIARSAFGELYFWGERTGASLKITSCFSRCYTHVSKFGEEQSDKRLQNFFLGMSAKRNDFANMFKFAAKKIGVLNIDEMYGFVPALMLGGSDTLDHLEKVKAVEHLIFLSQLDELKPYDFSVD